jgi:hypothetical protein
MTTKPSIPSVCIQCGKDFLAYPQQKREKQGIYCSRPCYHAARTRPVAERFWEKVDKSGDCWVWTASKHAFGYGQFGFTPGERPIGSHRASWLLHNGPIPGGLHVLHSCHNPACVRIDHLYLGTPADNMRDVEIANRHPRKLTPDIVREIRSRYAEGGITKKALGIEYGVNAHAISLVIARRTWQHVT